MPIPTFRVLTVVLIAAGVMAADTTSPGKLQPGVFTTSITKQLQANYLLALPAGYAKDGPAWPLVVYLHGSGEIGDNPADLTRHGPPRLISEGQAFPFIMLAPQCAPGEGWPTESLLPLLDRILAEHHVDPDRVYLTGNSMGGHGTWRLAQEHPQRWAAIAPICGRGDPSKAQRIAHVPTWIFHGLLDGTVPVSGAEDMYINLRAYGAPVKLTIYPDIGHDSWTSTYSDPAFWTWLLAQRRSAPPTTPPTRVKTTAALRELEVESFALSNVQVVDLPGASGGKAVRFDEPGGEATTTLHLTPGGYRIIPYQLIGEAEHDSVFVRVGTQTWGSFHRHRNQLAPSDISIFLRIETETELPLTFLTKESGVSVDKVVIEPLY